ncbi:FmdE family protein [Deferrisoma camini]|uniref:FmdE family protein n=1 Tax=Deferrisoma camini TaxID=1035120 RepID=UPI00046D809C|nr:FmdE family protein [Deferrisoma camini]
MQFEQLFDMAVKFHGHRCPAMPMGLRAGLAAMKVLGAERAQDKELYVISETGKGHAAGCFLDGIMAATGCTYGKSNIEKRYWNKMAFTLVDTRKGKAVRVSLKPEFFEQALQSPFVQQRRKGVPPQDVPAEVLEPLLQRVLSLPEEQFLDISDPFDFPWEGGQACFDVVRCDGCGEAVFTNAVTEKDGKTLCGGCAPPLQG